MIGVSMRVTPFRFVPVVDDHHLAVRILGRDVEKNGVVEDLLDLFPSSSVARRWTMSGTACPLPTSVEWIVA